MRPTNTIRHHAILKMYQDGVGVKEIGRVANASNDMSKTYSVLVP